MPKIVDFQKLIAAFAIQVPVIVPSTGGRYLQYFATYPIVQNVFNNLNHIDGNLCVTRQDIFNTPNFQERIVKMMIWGIL